MAMDFPVSPVDKLPIFTNEAASAAALMELIGPWGRGDDVSANGSRGAVGGGFGQGSYGQMLNGAACSEERTVAGGGAAMSGFSESEGDNGEALDEAEGEAHFDGDQEAVIQDQTDSADGCSAQSTGKVDPQAPGWTKRVRVGNQPPDRAPCPERVGADAVSS
ncbi:uncharacterized protein LOC125521180 [Triticum urartu]|nr:uncharacterized protein LOC125521180 [Triticum urartu]